MQSRIRPWRWRYVLLRCFTGYGLWRLLFWCFCVLKFCFLTSLPQGMGFEAHQPISDREKDGWDNIREPPWRLTSDFCQIGMRQTLCGLSLLNNPSIVPHSHITQVWALKSSNLHQIPAGQMTEHICKRLNPAKFTSTIPPLLPVETSTLRGSISDITTSQVLSPQLKLPSYIISDRSTPTSGP